MVRVFRRRDARGRPVGPWYALWYDAAGHRHQRSTRLLDRRAAEALQREWERAAVDPAYAAATTRTLTDALLLLLDARDGDAARGDRSPHTAAMYRRCAGHLVRVLGATRLLRDVTAERVDGYLATRRAESVSDSTVHKELVTLRIALKMAARYGWWTTALDAVLPATFSARYVPRTRYLTRDELARLLPQLDPDWAARCAFLVATSARWGESERARVEDVAPDRTWVRLRGTKTAASARVVPIVSAAADLLRYAQAHAAGAEGRLFGRWRSPGNALRRACVRAGIPHCSPNDLRRTFATWLRQAGARPDQIAPAMGHVDSAMVERVYGRHDVSDPSALRAQLEAATVPPPDCSTGAAAGVDRRGFAGLAGLPAPRKARRLPGNRVGHDGLEPSANGLRVRALTEGEERSAAENPPRTLWPAPRAARAAALVQQPATIAATAPRRRGAR